MDENFHIFLRQSFICLQIIFCMNSKNIIGKTNINQKERMMSGHDCSSPTREEWPDGHPYNTGSIMSCNQQQG